MSEHVRKATAVVFRDSSGGKEVLVFDHPLQDGGLMVQLPAGTIEPHETPESAAVRELFEETGVQASVPSLAAVLDEVFEGSERRRWIYVFNAPVELPDEWTSTCDCGAAIRCHWLSFDQAVVADQQQPWLDAARAFVRRSGLTVKPQCLPRRRLIIRRAGLTKTPEQALSSDRLGRQVLGCRLA